MAIDVPKSDLERSVQHDANQDWPHSVKIQLQWVDRRGRPVVRSEVISADAFFGRGKYGAPLSGEHLIQAIERMRRLGPPKVRRIIR